jgi:hypothetical protein
MKHLRIFMFVFCLLTSSYSLAVAAPAPVPQTGQTTCSNSSGTVIPCTGTGQDGALKSGVAWPVPRFTDTGTGTVTDNLTGLIWTKDANAPGPAACAPGVSKTWQAALDYAACLNTNKYLGYADWRVPSIRELVGLVDTSRSNPALPAGHPFTSVQSGNYWSSTSGAFGINNAWGVVMDYGTVINYGKIYSYSVWPVRSGLLSSVPAPTPKSGQTVSSVAGDDGALQPGVASPSPRFVDNANGSVTDRLTGLTWLKDANCYGSQNWDTALQKANALAGGACGLSDGSEAGDWHLPNRNELWSLVDYGRSNPALPSGHPFTSVQSNIYWSSTSYASNTSYAWYVNVSSGTVNYGNKYSSYSVWPVRSGQFWSFGSLILSTSATDFGTIPIGRASAASQVRIRNSGVAAASFSALISGADASHFTTVPGGTAPCSSLTPTLDAGAACTLLVTATPTNSGPKSANLTINSAGTSKDIPLTATAYSTLLGTITDMSNGLPVAGASVALTGGAAVSSDSSGAFSFGPSITAGSYSITASKSGYQNVTVSNLTVSAIQNGSANILLPTSGPLNITSTVLPSATAATAYSRRVMVAGGTAPYTFSKVSGDLPSGLAFDTVTGTITGTPTGSGSYTFAIGVTDSASGYSERQYTIDMVAALGITSTSLARATSGSSYPATLTASGGTSPYTFTVTSGSLAGLTLAAGGTFTGTLTSTGDFPVTIKVTDSTGRTASNTMTLSVDAPLVISTTRLDDGKQGTAFSFTTTASGGYGGNTWTVTSGTLPPGITLDPSTGIISGQPANTGSFPLGITVQDAAGRTATKTVTLKITTPLVITTASLAVGYLGTPYSESIQTTGGISPFSFSYTGVLPTGLALGASTGTISGTPSVAGLTNLSISVTDSTYPTPVTVSQSVSLRIWNALSIAPTSIPTATQKAAYSTTLTGIGGAVPHSWSIATGTLPQGLNLDSATGTIAGTPANCGAFPVTARLTDSAPAPKSVDKALTLTIACSNDYIISGNAGAAGATVTYSGTASGTVTADSNGAYSIGPLLNGTYTVTPSKQLYIFTPASSTTAVKSNDVSLVAFVAEAFTSKAGDCDNSGTVTIAEVQSAINMFLGLKTVEACVNQDGVGGVSIAEVQKVINSFLGL